MSLDSPRIVELNRKQKAFVSQQEARLTEMLTPLQLLLLKSIRITGDMGKTELVLQRTLGSGSGSGVNT